MNLTTWIGIVTSLNMPRQPRLDAPGTLHHVMGRSLEKMMIFRNAYDREDFLTRVEELCSGGSWIVYAWALLPNHFHILARTGNESLSKNMRSLKPPECEEPYLSLINPLRDSTKVFWTTQENSHEFRVSWQRNEITRCTIGAGVCEFRIP